MLFVYLLSYLCKNVEELNHEKIISYITSTLLFFALLYLDVLNKSVLIVVILTLKNSFPYDLTLKKTGILLMIIMAILAT